MLRAKNARDHFFEALWLFQGDVVKSGNLVVLPPWKTKISSIAMTPKSTMNPLTLLLLSADFAFISRSRHS